METSQEQNAKQERRQRLTGIVTSAAGDKTIRVVVEALVQEPTYGKYLRRRTKLAVHDESNAAAKGDTVEITTCRRVSKTKAYRLLKVIKKGVVIEPVDSAAERG